MSNVLREIQNPILKTRRRPLPTAIQHIESLHTSETLSYRLKLLKFPASYWQPSSGHVPLPTRSPSSLSRSSLSPLYPGAGAPLCGHH